MASDFSLIHGSGDVTALVDAINFRTGDTGITAKVDQFSRTNRDGNLQSFITIQLSNDAGENITVEDLAINGLNRSWAQVWIGIEGWDPLRSSGMFDRDVGSRGRNGMVGFKSKSTTEESVALRDATVVGGRLSLFSADPFSVQPADVRAGTDQASILDPRNRGARVAQLTPPTTEIELPKLLSGINISTVAGANSAILVVDRALEQVSTARARLGALQTRFEVAAQNQRIAGENLSAARSRILDADYAAESASWSRAKILQQAGTAALAQANVVPRDVVALLRNVQVPLNSKESSRIEYRPQVPLPAARPD